MLAASASARATGCSCCSGAQPELYVAVLGTLKHAASCRRCSPPSAPSRSAQRLRLGGGAGAGHHAGALPAQGRRRCATSCRRCEHVLLVGRRPPAAGTLDLDRADGAASDDFAIAADRPGGPGAAALHQRHDRHARRARSTCTRRWSPTTPPAGTRSTCTPTTSTGAPRTPAGSPARPTASSRR